MKKAFIIIILMALAAAGGYFYWNYWRPDKTVDLRAYVPEGAVWVYESEQTVQNWNHLIGLPLWENLSGIPFFASLETQVETLDSISGANGSIDYALRGTPFYISCHLTARNDFSYVFYLTLDDLKSQAVVQDILFSYRNNEAFASTTRQFSGQEIHEIKRRGAESSFSFILEKNYLIGSFTPFLVEDVIRSRQSKGRAGFFQNRPLFNSASKIADDDGNLYVDMTMFPKFLNAFEDGEYKTSPSLKFSESAFFDINMEENLILLNGIAASPDDSSYYLNAFRNQKASPLALAPVVPSRAAAFYHFTLSDIEAWQNALNAYWQAANQKFLVSRTQFEADYEINAPQFLNWVGAEIGLAVLETVDPQNPDKLLYVKAKDMNEGLNQLNRLAEEAAARDGDTVYHETYADYKITQINVEELPSLLFGPLFSGFQRIYFLVSQDYVIAGNSISALKTLISDIESENVWGKSVKQNLFLENTLNEANVSLFINTEKSWNFINQRLDEQWKPFFRQFGGQLRNFELLALQFNNIDNRFYTSVAAQYNETARSAGTPEAFTMEQEVKTDAPIITKPFVVRNHMDKSLEVFLQDSLGQIYLISRNGEIVWKKPLGENIVSEVHQVDFYKNNKLQYLFATEHALHIVDRNGEAISGYPFSLPDSIRVTALSLIDYDNSKRYRFLASDEKGNLYMFNTEKQNLEGWDPLKLKAAPACPPTHIRVRGRDYMIAVEKSGQVDVLTRRGTFYDGFPVDLRAPVNSPLFIEIGDRAENTRLTAVNQNGMIVQFNLKGETLAANQLYKPSLATTFSLCPGALNQTYVIARQDHNRLTILNKEGETLIEKDYVTSGDLSVQFYYFGSDNQIYAVTDRVQEFTYLYNQEGRLIHFQPLESGFEIGLIFSENQNRFRVYSCYGDRFTISSFNR